MEKLVFAESWQDYFATAGLKSFDDFYNHAGGIEIGRNERRNVHKLTFGEGADAKTFYMKRFHHSHLKDTIAAWCDLGRPASQGMVEWENANLLLGNGIDTYKPVCMGEITTCGFERKSLVITEQLQSVCMLDFVLEKWHDSSRETQDKIIVAMAELTRKAHQASISLRDLYIWHVFVYEDSLDSDCRLSVIDLHRMQRNVKSQRRKLENTAALYWSLSSDYFDDGHKDLFVNSYVDDGWAGDKAETVAGIEKRAAILDKRRKLAHYYAAAKRALGLD